MLATWGGGQLFAFSGLDGRTDYETGIVARTAKDGRAGIEIMLPARAMVSFDEAPPVEADMTGDTLRARTRAGETRMVFADARHLVVDGPCRLPDLPAGLRCATKGTRTLIAGGETVDESLLDADLDLLFAARRSWLAGHEVALQSLNDARQGTTRKCLSVMKTQVCSPQGRLRHRWTTPDRWPHRNIWLWDSAFHAIGWRHVDPALAREMLLAVLDTQQPDGRIPISATPVAHGMSSYTQPPVLTLAASLVDAAQPDEAWLSRVYPDLCRYIEWDLAHRDSDGAGLAEWAIEGDPGCRSGESGADNSSRFDSATQLDAPDFNAMLALEAELLGRFAERLEKPADAAKWREIHVQLCSLMNDRLWSEEHGIYMDAAAGTREHTGVLSCAGFMPLICGAATPAQAARLVEHLNDPATFGRPLPVPTIAPATSPEYAKDMWRGPAWVNINWLLDYGLRRYGLNGEADRLAALTCAAIERSYEEHGCIFEYYDDEGVRPSPELLRKGSCDPDQWIHQVIHDYGWSATLYVDWVMRGTMDMEFIYQ